jgi:hypothetical protein
VCMCACMCLGQHSMLGQSHAVIHSLSRHVMQTVKTCDVDSSVYALTSNSSIMHKPRALLHGNLTSREDNCTHCINTHISCM